MTDFAKLRARRRVLGSPPPIEEASENLAAPEVAPQAEKPQEEAQPEAPSDAQPIEAPRSRRDGRTLRRTNRTVAFATRVAPQFDERLRDAAARDGLMLVEVLERALDLYEAKARKRMSAS